MRPTLLYTHSEAVIPAPDRSRGQALAGIQHRKLVPDSDRGTGFRVKPGMTIKVKGLSTHYTRTLTGDNRSRLAGPQGAGSPSGGSRGLLRALGDLMEEELEAATDLQLAENITEMGLDGFLADAELRRDLFVHHPDRKSTRLNSSH